MAGSTTALVEFNAWLGTLPHKHKLITPGNHDKLCETDPGLAKTILNNAKLLMDEEVEVEGLRFFLSPWSPRFHNWSFMAERGAEIRAKWARIPTGVDVLVTHGPPMGILDTVLRFTRRAEFESESVGCLDLMRRVLDVAPRLHVFGHIHEGYGAVERPGTKFVNASICNEYYKPLNAPIVVELEPKAAA